MNTNTNTNTVLPFTAEELYDELYEVEASVDDRYPEDVVRTNYSGRGMYGRECFGVVVSNSDLMLVGIAFERLFERHSSSVSAVKLLKRTSMDSMGYDTIVYFPGFELAK